MPKSHNNQELFSNYYLEERLPERDTWQEPEELTETYEEISELYHERKGILEATKEAQTEEEWIKPILKILGFKYITQPSESIFNTTKVPDYAFFLNDDNKRKAYKAAEDNKKDLFNFALAVGDAKRWSRNLNELSPNKQIDEYLRITDSKWGILTNGRLWRIYHLDSSYRLDTYYEVDLVDLIAAGDVEKFKYFYLFFRPNSFVEEGFLTEVYERSEDFTASVSEDLKENAFDALRELCQGFLSGNPELGKEDLDDIYENSLVLLYRLIFLLYAESEEEENLLPMDNETYRESYSLEALKKKVIEKKKNNESLLSSSHRYWEWLRELFSFIDKGEETLGVYEYNGGLFDSKKYQFLDEKYKIGNKYIAEAIQKVSYSDTEGGFIDYQDLDVRELGAIYEGLLEHQPIVEEEKVKWEEDLSERKKTGSYYTPEYIVKYIVENTIGPLVEDKKEEIEEEINELREKLKGSRGYDRETYQRKLEEKRKKVRQEILDLKVLDPAMGSGHFLVEATEKLANSIASLEEELSPEEEQKSTVQETEKEDTVKELKRQIVERSIYGVDKNPLATELAKLSLWLHTVAKGEPLSFLDHHLRTGDSLIGIDIEEMKTMPSEREQMAGLFTSNLVQDLGNAIGHLNLIEEITSGSRDDVQEKKTEWRDVRDWIDKYKKAANVRLSTSFGNEISDDEYRAVLQSAANDELASVENKSYFNEAQQIADQKKFFHWELEFPDVFRNKKGKKRHKSGFDVVLGNPPYIEFKTDKSKTDRSYLRQKYDSAYGKFDYYIPFVEKAVSLMTPEGSQSFIMPKAFTKRRYGKQLRDILSNFLIDEMVDFADLQIFEGATNYVCILIVRNSERDGDIQVTQFKEGKEKSRKDIADGIWGNKGASSFVMQNNLLGSEPWKFVPKEEKRIFDLIQTHDKTKTLDNLNSVLWEGVASGKDEVFFIDKDEKETLNLEDEITHPIIQGKEVKRWQTIVNPELFVIYPYNLKTKEPYSESQLEREFSNAYKYLKSKRNELSGRGYFENSNKNWYELWNQRDPALFSEEKILTPYVSDTNNFALSGKNVFFNTCAYGVKVPGYSNSFILGILNSKLIEFFHKINTVKQRGGHFRYATDFLELLPVYIEEKEEIVELAREAIKIRSNIDEEIHSFLEWVELEWNIEIENLALKTHMKEYWNFDFVEMSRIAQKNKSQIEGSVDSRKFKDLFKKEWKRSSDKLKHMTEKLNTIERRIDAKVFELYSLNEGEVRTVLDSLETPAVEKTEILEKFRQVA